jgi:hypothetical protein
MCPRNPQPRGVKFLDDMQVHYLLNFFLYHLKELRPLRGIRNVKNQFLSSRSGHRESILLKNYNIL